MIKERYEALYNATEPFRETKRQLISRICSVGVRHRWLKWPSFIAAFFFILFVNVAFYVCLWVMLNVKLAIGLLITAIAGIGLFVVLKDYGAADELYTKTNDDFVIIWDTPAENEDEVYVSEEELEAPEEYVPKWYEMAEVDFDSLCSINPDIVGWLYFENEDISYPILHGETDDEYINTTYEGKRARAGSIFLESLNSRDFSDEHTIIYGHNMRNLSMFGRLRYYYMDSDYYANHKYFQIITPEESYRYVIVSCKHVPGDDQIYSIFGQDTIGYADFVQNCIMQGSLIKSEYVPSYNDSIVTLSTCSDGNNRFVVNAARIDIH